jgi:hypothetical protein
MHGVIAYYEAISAAPLKRYRFDGVPSEVNSDNGVWNFLSHSGY